MCTAAYSTAQTDAAISAVERWIANDVGITPGGKGARDDQSNVPPGYPQAWFPIAGYGLRVPVSWSVIPGR